MADTTIVDNNITYLDIIPIEIMYTICEYLDLRSLKNLQRIYRWIATDSYFRFLFEVKIFAEHKNPVRYIKKYVKRNGVNEFTKLMRKAFKLQVGNMERELINSICQIPRTELIRNKEFINEYIDMYTKFLSPSSEYFEVYMKKTIFHMYHPRIIWNDDIGYIKEPHQKKIHDKIVSWIESGS